MENRISAKSQLIYFYFPEEKSRIKRVVCFVLGGYGIVIHLVQDVTWLIFFFNLMNVTNNSSDMHEIV